MASKTSVGRYPNTRRSCAFHNDGPCPVCRFGPLRTSPGCGGQHQFHQVLQMSLELMPVILIHRTPSYLDEDTILWGIQRLPKNRALPSGTGSGRHPHDTFLVDGSSISAATPSNTAGTPAGDNMCSSNRSSISLIETSVMSSITRYCAVAMAHHNLVIRLALQPLGHGDSLGHLRHS